MIAQCANVLPKIFYPALLLTHRILYPARMDGDAKPSWGPKGAGTCLRTAFERAESKDPYDHKVKRDCVPSVVGSFNIRRSVFTLNHGANALRNHDGKHSKDHR